MFVLRRLSWLLLLLAAAAGGYVLLRRRDDDPPPVPEWPPFHVDTPPVAPVAPAVADPSDTTIAAPAAADDAADATWVPAVDGTCPLDHPVKANDNSRIYHVPGGRFYDRTRAERCYARADDAEADGYRAAKA